MAIKKLPDSTQEDIRVSIDNGDLRALDSIQKLWDFKDKESVLRFALAVLISAKSKSVKISDEEGHDVSISPADNLLNLKGSLESGKANP